MHIERREILKQQNTESGSNGNIKFNGLALNILWIKTIDISYKCQLWIAKKMHT